MSTPPLTRRERRRIGVQKVLREKLEKKIIAEFTTAFGPGQPFGGQPVIVALNRLFGEVSWIVREFDGAVK